MNKIIVRPAKEADLPAIYELVRELAIFEKEEAAFTIGMDEYHAQFKEGLFQVIVAQSIEEIIGMALFYPTFSTWKGKMMYLEDFVVKTAHRRKGVGQLLFDAFIETSKQQHCKLVKWQVLDWNQSAIDFYIKQDAIIEREWYNGKILFEL